MILQPVRLVHHQYLPLDRCQLRKILCHQHLRRGDDHLDHPRALPFGAPLLGHLLQVPLVERHVLDTIAGKDKLVLAGAFAIIVAAMVHDCVEVGPSRELAVPVGDGGEGRHDKEGTAGDQLLRYRVHVGGCLDGFSQSHLIRQDGAPLVQVIRHEPAHSLCLVIPQLSPHLPERPLLQRVLVLLHRPLPLLVALLDLVAKDLVQLSLLLVAPLVPPLHLRPRGLGLARVVRRELVLVLHLVEDEVALELECGFAVGLVDPLDVELPPGPVLEVGILHVQDDLGGGLVVVGVILLGDLEDTLDGDPRGIEVIPVQPLVRLVKQSPLRLPEESAQPALRTFAELHHVPLRLPRAMQEAEVVPLNQEPFLVLF
mmetsp:Transcript_32873/g.69985  ORF Transcript_32873/g.69985 Transcript_32873/m.69985 type:complete len:371 (+) Transcript_32873:1321-2433(+)